MYLGIHISGPEFKNLVKNPTDYKINAIQYMPTAPMRWVTKPIPQENIDNFAKDLQKTSIKKVLLHGIYLTNLAREDKQLFHLGKMGLVEYLDFAQRLQDSLKKNNSDIEVLGVCFHPGSMKEYSYEESLERISYGIQWVLDNTQGTQKLLIETTAGTGGNLGRTFEELKTMRDGVNSKERVGFVVDTEHTFAAGYDWVSDFDNVVSSIKNVLGIENIASFHLNDSMVDCGSRKDRHANLGEGKIGEETIRKMLHCNDFQKIPFLLETPGLKSHTTLMNEINSLNNFAK